MAGKDKGILNLFHLNFYKTKSTKSKGKEEAIITSHTKRTPAQPSPRLVLPMVTGITDDAPCRIPKRRLTA